VQPTNLYIRLFRGNYGRCRYAPMEKEISLGEMLFSPNALVLLNLYHPKIKVQDSQIVPLPHAGYISPPLLNDLNNPSAVYNLLTLLYCVTCRPHSFLLLSSHHHLPARKSSPLRIARVQG